MGITLLFLEVLSGPLGVSSGLFLSFLGETFKTNKFQPVVRIIIPQAVRNQWCFPELLAKERLWLVDVFIGKRNTLAKP